MTEEQISKMTEEQKIVYDQMIAEDEMQRSFRKVLIAGINNTSRIYNCKEQDKLVDIINQFSLDEDDCLIASPEIRAIISDDHYYMAVEGASNYEYDHSNGLEKAGYFGDKLMPKRFVIHVDPYLPATILILCKEKDIENKDFKACGVIYGHNSWINYF